MLSCTIFGKVSVNASSVIPMGQTQTMNIAFTKGNKEARSISIQRIGIAEVDISNSHHISSQIGQKVTKKHRMHLKRFIETKEKKKLIYTITINTHDPQNSNFLEAPPPTLVCMLALEYQLFLGFSDICGDSIICKTVFLWRSK